MATVTKLSTNANLQDPAAWSTGTVPTSIDIATFSSTSLKTGLFGNITAGAFTNATNTLNLPTTGTWTITNGVSATGNTGPIAGGGSGFNIRINGSGQTAFTRYQGFDANNTFTANFYVEGTWAYLFAEAGFTTALGNGNNPIYISGGQAVLGHTTGSYTHPVYPTGSGKLQVSGGAAFAGTINFQAIASSLQFQGGAGGLTGRVTGGTTTSNFEFITGTVTVSNTSNDFNGWFTVTSGTVTFNAGTIPSGSGKNGLRLRGGTTYFSSGNYLNDITVTDGNTARLIGSGSSSSRTNLFGSININSTDTFYLGYSSAVVNDSYISVFGSTTISTRVENDDNILWFENGSTTTIYNALFYTATVAGGETRFRQGSTLYLGGSLIGTVRIDGDLRSISPFVGQITGSVEFGSTFRSYSSSPTYRVNLTVNTAGGYYYPSTDIPEANMLDGSLTISGGSLASPVTLGTGGGNRSFIHSSYSTSGFIYVGPFGSSLINLTLKTGNLNLAGATTFLAYPSFNVIDIQTAVSSSASSQDLIAGYNAIVRLSNTSNTFTSSVGCGTNSTTGGIIEFNTMANGGSASSLGAGATAQPIVYFGPDGILRCIGSGGGTNRPLATNTAGTEPTTYTRTIESSGTGLIGFASSTLWTMEGLSSTNLVLSGSYTGDYNIIQQPLSSVATTSMYITKRGNAKWRLDNSITWTNATTNRKIIVEAGYLRISNLDVIPKGLTKTFGLEINGGTLEQHGQLGTGFGSDSMNIFISGSGVSPSEGAINYVQSSSTGGLGGTAYLMPIGNATIGINRTDGQVVDFGSNLGDTGDNLSYNSYVLTFVGNGNSSIGNFSLNRGLGRTISNFVKNGTGQTTLVSSFSQHTGSIIINDGIVQCNGTGSTGSGANNHVVVNGGTLRAITNISGKSLITKNLTFNGGSMTIG